MPALNSQAQTVYTVVLAAGASRRLGQPKQALPLQSPMGDQGYDQTHDKVYDQGQTEVATSPPAMTTLLDNAVAQALAVTPRRVICVLGAYKPSTPLACQVVCNNRWRDGMASSLICGVNAVPASASVLVTLCDQPAVGQRQLARLLAAHHVHPGSTVAADYGRHLGVPAIFPPSARPALLSLTGDQGARSLLETSAPDVMGVAMVEATLDIDTDEDWARWTRHSGQTS